MKIVSERFFILKGQFASSHEFSKIQVEIKEGIEAVVLNSADKFIINPIRKGNGVLPIKDKLVEHLTSCGWEAEQRMSLAQGMNPGPIDVIKETPHGLFAVEWETGNISSSHRALNKIAVGIIQGQIVGGILILPIKNLARYLTDRIGNYEEIEPYFPLYQNLSIGEGVIGVIGIEHDGEDTSVPVIPKGKDGNSKKS